MCSFPDFPKEFEASGFAVLKTFLTSSEVDSLLNECSSIVEHMNPPDHCSVFHTGKNQGKDRDDYFINSGDKISFFFEKDAVDESGHLKIEKAKSLNKIGHALHWLNPVFKEISFSSKVKDIFRMLQYKDPVVVQSMFIFKHPEIGGIVTPHQDSTFLYTDPPSAVGIWLPLVDVTLDNGCLWFIPGSHKKEIHQRFVRNPDGNPQLLLKGEMPTFNDEDYVPVLVQSGDCVVIHGSVIHQSGKNLTNKSRSVYTFHVVEQENAKYSEVNWLQPTKNLPFPSLYSN